MKKDFEVIDSQDVKFEDLENIEAYTCVLGLSFPESATDFQKASLCLAHLMAAIRESVLKGVVIPINALTLVYGLANVMANNENKQK